MIPNSVLIQLGCSYRIENDVVIWLGDNPPTQDEIEELTVAEPMRLLRAERNQLLKQTDWRMVSDYPGSNQTEWQTYRQTLRDITTQTPSLDENGNLMGITWPTPPTD